LAFKFPATLMLITSKQLINIQLIFEAHGVAKSNFLPIAIDFNFARHECSNWKI